MKKLAAAGIASLALFSALAFAQSGSGDIPGIVSGSGSAGSTIKNSRIIVSGNSAKNVVAVGGSVGVGKIAANVDMNSLANVNTVNVTGSRVSGSDIGVIDSRADGVTAVGGTANVNSININ